MSVYGLILFVHVLAGVVLLGGSIFAPLTRAAIRRAETLGALRSWLDFARRSARANPVAAMLLLGTGLYLGSAGWWSAPWFAAASVLFVINSAFAARVVAAESMRLGRAAAVLPDGAVPDHLDRLRWSLRWDTAADVLVACDVATLFLMTNKPTGAVTLATAALAISAVAGRRWLRRRGDRGPATEPSSISSFRAGGEVSGAGLDANADVSV
ncbi:MAG: DUF2269 family protein [Deltaproteobacteria bacterium]|nr:DUF2269 family protein [Deltaproteobacteria bacterium]